MSVTKMAQLIVQAEKRKRRMCEHGPELYEALCELADAVENYQGDDEDARRPVSTCRARDALAKVNAP